MSSELPINNEVSTENTKLIIRNGLPWYHESRKIPIEITSTKGKKYEIDTIKIVEKNTFHSNFIVISGESTPVMSSNLTKICCCFSIPLCIIACCCFCFAVLLIITASVFEVLEQVAVIVGEPEWVRITGIVLYSFGGFVVFTASI